MERALIIAQWQAFCLGGDESSGSAIMRLNYTNGQTSHGFKPLSHPKTSSLWRAEEPGGAIKAPSRKVFSFNGLPDILRILGNR
jgi:hypothetical protein